jgi:hypothetical protein
MPDVSPRTSRVAWVMHDLALAAWFGGSLMGAVGLNAASAAVDDPSRRLRVATAGWSSWVPMNTAAVGTHLASLGLLAYQQGSGTPSQRRGASAMVKPGLTALALAMTAWGANTR